MKLSKVVIKNFRSIKNLAIDLSGSSTILVGKNEAGKSNILRAMHMLSPDVKPRPQDVRQPLPSEDEIDQANIQFLFDFSSSDVKEIFRLCQTKILCTGDSEIATIDGENLNLFDFCSKKKGDYFIDCLQKRKSAIHHPLKGTLQDVLKKLAEKFPASAGIIVEGTQAKLKSYKLIDTALIKFRIPSSYLERASFEYFDAVVGAAVRHFIEKNLPHCIFWKYKSEHLLPDNIPIVDFKADSEKCIPLKQMFLLSDIAAEEISDRLTRAEATNHGLRNLLSRVARRATDYIHNVWEEHQDFEIYLDERGESIRAGVKDKEDNIFSFAQRSDGFKRLVSFLLMVASVNHKRGLQDALILIDEPDIGLHPSAGRHLRDELTKIAENNVVVYSTHSVSMIDSENIERHLIVERKDEITSIKESNQSKIIDEEIIFNAIGYSVFEHMKKINIIFEGWRDKQIFRVALGDSRMEPKVRNVLKEIGLTHAQGVKEVSTIANLLELANRKIYIISDGDNPAREKQKEHIKGKLPGKWLKYSEISETQAITGEDFISIERINKVIDEMKKELPADKDLDIQFDENKTGVLQKMKDALSKINLDDKSCKDFLNSFKEKMYDGLKSSDIRDDYFIMLDDFSKKVIEEDKLD